MSKSIKTTIVLALLLILTFSRSSDAAFFGLPKAMKSPLDGIEMSMPVWGPTARSLYCIEHLAACQPKRVALFSMPKALKPQLDRIPMDLPTLGPFAHNVFCTQYPRDCEVRRIAFRGQKFKLTPTRLHELSEVNIRVNRSIRPERNVLGVAGEKWLVAPKAGDCNDYAVTKRHELLDRGWPSRTLLLAEVVTRWGEHHLVLVVRTADGDLVLDNLNSNIRPWKKSPYLWARIQSPRNPKFWSTVKPIAQSA